MSARQNCQMDIQWIIAIATCVGVFITLVGVVVAVWHIRANHERRKKQATIEFYHIIDDHCTESLRQIDKKFPRNNVISVSDIESDKSGDDTLRAIKKYLYHMECLSVGINTKVYDIFVFERMAGNFTVRWFDRLKEVIISFRKDFDSQGCPKSHAYKDFEDVVSRLKEVRKKRFPMRERDLAKMKHS